MSQGLHSTRRDFLIRCCQGAALLPAGLRGLAFPSLFALDRADKPSAGEFHLHPRYRSPLPPLDAIFSKVKAGSDDFITEKYADEIQTILMNWSSALRTSAQDLDLIDRVLAPLFSGSSLRASKARPVRSGAIEVHRNEFSQQEVISKDAFLQELRSALGSFSQILTAEFQVTRIEAPTECSAGDRAGCREGAPANGGDQSANSLTRIWTRVRYELVGTGRDAYRQQRVGYWDLRWERSFSGALRLFSWRPIEEKESRSYAPAYVDVAAQALAGNASLSAQLLHGTDYWRTVLDGACGIDIYGHNGVSVGDIDNDGFDDLYICQPAGLPNRLFRNRGDGTFEDITESSGVGVLENTACALFLDVNNRGRQDLIVVRANGPLLFLNEGKGKFRQKPEAFQFATPPQGTFTGAAAADYDRDGWLDIYFCLYVYYQGTEQYKYPSPYFDAENGPPNFMMRNHRDGTFHDVTRKTGLDRNNTRYSFCCGWGDFNGDGWPDLYVVNDFGRKNLYRNNGNGTFTDLASATGVEDVGAGMGVCWFDYDNDGAPDLYVADMWTASGERVTSQEIFKKSSPKPIRALYQKHAMGNSLFRNGFAQQSAVSPASEEKPLTTGGTEVHGGNQTRARATSGFQKTTDTAGVGLGRWAWACDAWDFDHDGYPDLYVANGMISGPPRSSAATRDASGNSGEDLNSFFWRQVVARSPDQAQPSHDYEQGWNAVNELIRADGTWSGYERNIFYANNRDGTFSDISGVIGLDFLEDGRAFALADFDHDGRQELLLKNRNSPQLRLLKNVMEKLPPSISFRLRGTKSNRDAIGASITIQTEGAGAPERKRRQTRFVQAGSGFLSQHSKEVFFGLGDAKGPIAATIRWPSGVVQELRDLPIDHRIWVEEGSATPRMEALAVSPWSLKPHQQDLANYTPESLPGAVETWLLAPVSAPDFLLPDLDGRMQSLSTLRGRTLLLNFWIGGLPDCQADFELFSRKHSAWAREGLQLLTINFDQDIEAARTLARDRHLAFPILRGSDDVAGVYTIVYRYLFDRHRDLSLPTSFLINGQQEIVKVYQGPLNPEHLEYDFAHIPLNTVDRLARALPFPGITEAAEFGRNYLSYGSVFFQRGYLEQAAAAFQRALHDDPSSAEALYGLGSVYLNQQKMPEARDCFERTIKLTASYPDTLPNAWNNLGLIAAREGRTEQAIPYFQEALRQSPDHAIALVNLGSAYRQLQRWDESRKAFERALASHPDDAEANYGLGMVFAQNDDTDHAYEYLQRALRARPAYPEALNNLGILYLRTHRRDHAVATFEECIRVAPAFDQAYVNLARVYVIEEQPEKARTILEALLKQHPDHAQAQKMLEQLPK
jgi:tetratricopeptide (TPR) repeat protein/thiol-disulfide isomerase/thioredoxin